ncbi:MAG: hypothetical protein Q8Q15_01245, partial [bacterium]|nr:hypothetical protein [bacterium]
MYKDTPNIIKIITAFILALTGFLLFPKEAEAYGSPGYGWGKMEWSTGAENTHIYTTRDADTGALISTDKLNIFVTGPGAFPGSYVEYHCAASCPPTVTLTGIPSGVRVDFYGSAEKAGYSSTSNPGAFRIDPPGLDGNNVLTLNTYLTRVGIPPRGEAVFPAPLWYDYVPSPVIRVYPSFGASQAWVRWGADRYGPYSAPFPQEATIPPVAAWTDGWAGGGLTIEDELGFRSSDVGFGFGLDRSAPIVSCSISPSGIITYPTNVAVTLNESDTLSGIAEGDVDVRVGGGPWENTGLPSSGNTTNDFTYAASGNGTYEFRYRARDNTINSAGVGDQWSDYVSCGVVT